MTQQEIIKACDLLVTRNKGISLTEEYLLKDETLIDAQAHGELSPVELVSLAIKTIQLKLGRANITPRDLKKAVVNVIEL